MRTKFTFHLINKEEVTIDNTLEENIKDMEYWFDFAQSDQIVNLILPSGQQIRVKRKDVIYMTSE